MPQEIKGLYIFGTVLHQRRTQVSLRYHPWINYKDESKQMMKPILAYLHLYYTDMLEEMLSYIQNLSEYNYDLYITMVEDNKDVISKIKKAMPKAHIVLVDNRGFDVWPFLRVLQMVNIDDYSYIVKLHTKRNMPVGCFINNFNTSGPRHRKFLLNFIKNKKNIKKCIDSFAKDSRLGMISSYKIIARAEKWDQFSHQQSLALLDKLGLSKDNLGFVAGTMFIVRAKLMQPLLDLNLKKEDFAISERGKNSLAHVIERFLGHIVIAQGYKIEDCTTPYYIQRIMMPMIKVINPTLKFIYSRKHTKSDKILIKIFKIPVYSKKISKF